MKASNSGSDGSGDKASTGGRFWKGKKLGSQDYTLGERSVGDNGTMDGEGSVANGTATEYRTYKRRWIGLVVLTLMNIVISWDVRQNPDCAKPQLFPNPTQMVLSFWLRNARKQKVSKNKGFRVILLF